ncbi:MAG: hypothetical protein J6M92_07690 [Oribacterium sp.]|nr:hypothetical protein [Oribacterium sp.]
MASEKARLRRYENDLYVSGTGVIVMGAWGIMKMIIQLLLGADNVFKTIEAETELERNMALGLAFIMFTVIVLIIMMIHLYIGLNAARAARGRPYKKGYYFGAIILLVLSVLSMPMYRESLKDLSNIDTTGASILVDLTTIYVFYSVIRSTNEIKKLKKKLSGE